MKPSPANWMKVNVDVSRRDSTRTAFVGYFMRDDHLLPLWQKEVNW